MIMSNLLLNRLLIISKGNIVYDENFHKGLNIIRGQNGSGKSTIIELIYYALGADQLSWKEEALKCDYVIAEIMISNHVLSIKRDINDEGTPPIFLFWGKIDEATITSWERYSMKRSNERESFSQIIFRALNIPDSNITDNLTMHQILRILYIDQLSPPYLLIRPEQFDPSTMKDAISRTLMGAYDIQLFSDENILKEKKKEAEKYDLEIRNISYIIKENGFNLSIEDVRKKLNENIERINIIDKSLSDFNQEVIDKLENKKDNKTEKLFKRMKEAKEKYIESTEKYNSLNYDIIDSERFIAELKQRYKDLNNSISLREFLPTLHISFCPICLNPIDSLEKEDICPLCKKSFSENDLTINALRLKNELAFQIKESEAVLGTKKNNVGEIKIEISTILKKITLLQNEIDSYSVAFETTEQKERDELLFIKGNLSKEIEYLNKELIFQERLKEDIRILENLKADIYELELQIGLKKERLAKNYNEAMNVIKNIAIEFIKMDIPRDLPADDYLLQKLDINFANNTFSINKRYNYAASSMAYLKNSIMLAFFFASLDLTSMNYPKFFICDNIEDKGMEETRSHNFQLRIYERSKLYKDIDHQLIITTSMIEPSLDNPEICVGEYYTNESKSLRLENE